MSYRTKLSEDNNHIIYCPIASSPVPTERSDRREAIGPNYPKITIILFIVL